MAALGTAGRSVADTLPRRRDAAGGECLGRPYLFGCGVMRRYGLTAVYPFGNFCLRTSGSCSDGTMMTSWPSFQLTGVATEYLSVSCSESTTRRISSKLRPVLAGYVMVRRTFLFGSMTK